MLFEVIGFGTIVNEYIYIEQARFHGGSSDFGLQMGGRYTNACC